MCSRKSNFVESCERAFPHFAEPRQIPASGTLLEFSEALQISSELFGCSNHVFFFSFKRGQRNFFSFKRGQRNPSLRVQAPVQALRNARCGHSPARERNPERCSSTSVDSV